MSNRLKSARVRVGRGGRLVIPAPMRRRLRLDPGVDAVLTEVEGHLEVTTAEAALAEFQKEVARYVPADVSLVDELIAERRREAAQDR